MHPIMLQHTIQLCTSSCTIAHWLLLLLVVLLLLLWQLLLLLLLLLLLQHAIWRSSSLHSTSYSIDCNYCYYCSSAFVNDFFCCNTSMLLML
jgi:hypothetical protein